MTYCSHKALTFDTTIKLMMVPKRVLCGGTLQCGSVYEASSETIRDRQLAKNILGDVLDTYDSYVSQ